MNDIQFNCPHCGQSLAVDATGVGTSVACLHCGQTICVPQSTQLAQTTSPMKKRARVILGVVVVLLLLAGLLLWQRHERFRTAVASSSAPLSAMPDNLAPSALNATNGTISTIRMYPKKPAAGKTYVVNCINDSDEAKRTAFALQGLVNQSSAEVYLISSGEHEGQLKFCNKPFEIPEQLQGKDAGLRNLFQKYQTQVKKMFLYDPQKDWTWYLAQMAGAQQDGIPVTESLEHDLTLEFGWKGTVEDFRNRWPNQIVAYDWALANLMPNCSKQIVFTLNFKWTCDWVITPSQARDLIFGWTRIIQNQRCGNAKNLQPNSAVTDWALH